MKTESQKQIPIHPDFSKAILAVNNLNIALQKQGLSESFKEIRIALSAISKVDNRSKFEKFYDFMSEFLFAGKPFFTKKSNTL